MARNGFAPWSSRPAAPHRLSLCRRWIICSTSIRGGGGSSALPKATSTARYMSMMPAPPSPNTARMEGCDGQGPDQRKQSASARSEEHTSELQSLMRISYAVFCLKKKKTINKVKPNMRTYTNHLQDKHK